jgi:hypothetical protein
VNTIAPENALVLSVDEKPSIQALERATGYVQTSSGKIVRGLKSTYKRHGTGFALDSLLEESGFEPSVPPQQRVATLIRVTARRHGQSRGFWPWR